MTGEKDYLRKLVLKEKELDVEVKICAIKTVRAELKRWIAFEDCARRLAWMADIAREQAAETENDIAVLTAKGKGTDNVVLKLETLKQKVEDIEAKYREEMAEVAVWKEGMRRRLQVAISEESVIEPE